MYDREHTDVLSIVFNIDEVLRKEFCMSQNIDYLIKEDSLHNIADSIRNVDNTLGELSPAEMVNEIRRLTAVVDQSYNSSSTNPQSGLAVAEAVAIETSRATDAEDNLQNQIDKIASSNNNIINGEASGSLRTINSKEESEDYKLGENAFTAGEKTSAVSRDAASFGQENTSGSKGFTITACARLTDTTGTYTLSSIEGLEVGMEYNVKLSSAKYRSGNITAIDIATKTITVDNYPNIAISATDPNYLFITKRPDLGDTDIGIGAFTTGILNIAQSQGTFTSGKGNLALGEFSAVFGSQNTIGWAGAGFGFNNEALGDMAIISGLSNRISKNSSTSAIIGKNNAIAGASPTTFVTGLQNTVTDSDVTFVAGRFNKINSNNIIALGSELIVEQAPALGQIVLGRFNSNDNEAMLTIGAGNSDANRINALSVYSGGEVRLGKDGTEVDSLVAKGYIDDAVDKRVLINTTAFTGSDRVYGRNTRDNEAMFKIAMGAEEATIARRGAAGTLKVGTPVNELDATTKRYVDAKDKINADAIAENETNLVNETSERKTADNEITQRLNTMYEIVEDSTNYDIYIDTSDATAVADDIVEGKTAYARGEKLVGTRVPSMGDYDEIVLSGGTSSR